ncbi:hypothetical protein CLU79DRAFT_749614 [Phycomyces nitens]|nr:hypothetical protein CLU79DRAFT_749614 [Phycomyces nitens]
MSKSTKIMSMKNQIIDLSAKQDHAIKILSRIQRALGSRVSPNTESSSIQECQPAQDLSPTSEPLENVECPRIKESATETNSIPLTKRPLSPPEQEQQLEPCMKKRQKKTPPALNNSDGLEQLKLYLERREKPRSRSRKQINKHSKIDAKIVNIECVTRVVMKAFMNKTWPNPSGTYLSAYSTLMNIGRNTLSDIVKATGLQQVIDVDWHKVPEYIKTELSLEIEEKAKEHGIILEIFTNYWVGKYFLRRSWIGSRKMYIKKRQKNKQLTTTPESLISTFDKEDLADPDTDFSSD